MAMNLEKETRDYRGCSEHQKHLYRTNLSRRQIDGARLLWRIAQRHGEDI